MIQTTSKANNKYTVNGIANNQTGCTSANGWIVTGTVNTTGTIYKDYCFKCGKLKSAHKLFQGCPK